MLDVHDEILAKVAENIQTNLTLMARSGIGRQEEIVPAIKRIRLTRKIEEAAAGAQFVIEAVTENLGLKQKLF